jgi:hypothetical protein
MTVFIPYTLIITFINYHGSHRNFPQTYTFQSKSFKIQVKLIKLNMVLDKMPMWIVWWVEESAVMATFYHFRHVLVTKKAIIMLTLEVLVEVNTETAVFLDVMQHSLVDAYQHLGGTCCLHPWWETKPQPHLLLNLHFIYHITDSINFPSFFKDFLHFSLFHITEPTELHPHHWTSAWLNKWLRLSDQNN